MSEWHVRRYARHHPGLLGMPQMLINMPLEAHCQEDRGINAEVIIVENTRVY
jgi:hypothetical protein